MIPEHMLTVLLFLASSYKCQGKTAVQCPSEQPIYGKALKGYTFKTFVSLSSFECLVDCHYEDRCQSYNYVIKTNICEMNNRTKEAKPDQFVSDPDRFYMKRGAHRRQLGSIPTLPAQSCKEIKANEGGQAVSGNSWLDATGSGDVILAYCDMNTEALPKSCSHLKILIPTAESGTYAIDPDGEGDGPPFAVTCDMTDKNGVGVTVISHDSENRTLVDGCDSKGCYSRDIQYTEASLLQLTSLANISTQCEQFIKYECFGSKMFERNNFAWWVSRDSAKMTYWGGAEPGSNKCACGMRSSCAQPERSCNCGANDGVWREDSGLLTDKTRLPVKQLRFGDIGYDDNLDLDERGYHTLRKFKCYGIA